MEAQNTYYEITLNDGRTVKLTLNFARLYALRSKNRKAYDEYMKAKEHLDKADDIEMCKPLYTAYLCANSEAKESFVEFLELVPPDNYIVAEIIGKLMAPSMQKKNFQKHSKKQHQK